MGYDLPHHYQCAITFLDSIRTGDLYPSWSLNRNFGFGGMETRLYPPLSHYSLALAFLLIGNWHLATWLTLFFFTFAGSLGVYLWAREYVKPFHAVFAGSVFALLPYHLTQIYNTFFYAEYAGTSFLAFVFLFILRVCRRRRLSDVLGLGISYALLILTHLPLTVIGSICFLLFALSLLKRKNCIDQILALSAGMLIGLGGSAFFWIKVLQERHLLAKTLIYADPWLNYIYHFLATPLQSFTDDVHLSVYENATFFYDLMFLCAVGLAFAFSIPTLAAGAKEKLRGLSGVGLVFAAAIFFATPFSGPIWDRVILLQELQFPWRWVAIICVVAPVIAAHGLEPLLVWFRNSMRPAALIIVGVLCFVVTFSFFQIVRPAPFIAIADIEPTVALGETTEGFTFWWTIWSRKEAFEQKEKVLATGREVQIKAWNSTDREFEILGGDSAAIARAAVYYHPNWRVSVNGRAVEARPDENGALIFDIPYETSHVDLRFVEPPAVKIATRVSQSVWISLGLLLLFALMNNLNQRRHLN